MTTNNRPRPKTELLYWTERISFQTAASRTYSVQIQHAKRREIINLRTANKEEAATLARNFYRELLRSGWEQTLRWWKGDSTNTKKVDVTVGEYIDAVAEKSQIHPKTCESYSAALRKIASDIHNVVDKKRSTWRTQVDAIKLATLTAEMIEAWRADFIKRGSVNPVKEKSAKVSANSFIGRARSLFGADVIARVKDIVEIPSPIPFAGVKVEKVRVARYRSGFDMATLLESARAELADDKPEEFKIFLLAAMAGLRRNEIDKLPWSAFRWNEGLIRIEATEFFRPKSHESAGDVVVDPELIEIFRGYHARAKNEFVIESENEPDNGKPFEYYRCDREFAELIAWLRSHGVISRTPLHSLRKEFGSQINARYGLFAASSMLRHADLAVTAGHYVENKQRSVLGFGHLLKNERTIVPMDDAARSA
jgi:integrase